MAKATRRSFVTRLIAAAAFDRPGPDAPQSGPRHGKRAPALAARRPARLVDSVKRQLSGTPAAGPPGAVCVDEFNMVGQYDVDWLKDARLQRLLDNLAASPCAFRAIRFFHSLDSGTRANSIDDDPLDGGAVWPCKDAPIDFSRTFTALETLTSRGLVPFVVLNFFPKAVADQAATPPASFDRWQTLIRRFLDGLVADARFGPAALRNWRFEVWNEPNGAPFWRGRYNPEYFDLYRATSQAVLASGHCVQLGGPAIVYDGTPGSRADLEDFLRFVSAEGGVKCDFISLHAKGSPSSSGEPEFWRAFDAMVETAELALAIDPARFAGLPIINDEADMRIGFDVPYQARMDHRFAAWMCALMIAYDGLSSRFSAAGFRFLAASDNANQQLVREAFDGRRSLLTRASASPRDLLKLPVFNFYEILRLLGDRRGACVAGDDNVFPKSDLFHAVTVADSHIGSVFSVYPRSSAEAPRAWTLNYMITDIPWRSVNIARFRIDAAHSNAYTAAGGEARGRPFPSIPDAARIRQSQELAAALPIERGVTLEDGVFRDVAGIESYGILTYWITPTSDEPPADPVWLEAGPEDGNVILRWRPSVEPFFYSYEVYLIGEGSPDVLLSPTPLRSAMWVDTAPARGVRYYAVRAVTASGVQSKLIASHAVSI